MSMSELGKDNLMRLYSTSISVLLVSVLLSDVQPLLLTSNSVFSKQFSHCFPLGPELPSFHVKTILMLVIPESNYFLLLPIVHLRQILKLQF